MNNLLKNHLYKRAEWDRELQEVCDSIRRGNKVQFTSHFWESLKERSLNVGDVYSIFKNGSAEIIQGHAIGTYALNGGLLNTDEIRVFYGKTNKEQIIHVVMAIVKPGKYKFVTVYYPDAMFFNADMKTLKSEWAFKENKPCEELGE